MTPLNHTSTKLKHACCNVVLDLMLRHQLHFSNTCCKLSSFCLLYSRNLALSVLSTYVVIIVINDFVFDYNCLFSAKYDIVYLYYICNRYNTLHLELIQ